MRLPLFRRAPDKSAFWRVHRDELLAECQARGLECTHISRLADMTEKNEIMASIYAIQNRRELMIEHDAIAASLDGELERKREAVADIQREALARRPVPTTLQRYRDLAKTNPIGADVFYTLNRREIEDLAEQEAGLLAASDGGDAA
jgi:hypothetical protein